MYAYIHYYIKNSKMSVYIIFFNSSDVKSAPTCMWCGVG